MEAMSNDELIVIAAGPLISPGNYNQSYRTTVSADVVGSAAYRFCGVKMRVA
jgi:putative N-acetylmannosamine-6-phosphate epimerase